MDKDSTENDNVAEAQNQINGEEPENTEMTMTQDDDAYNSQNNGVRESRRSSSFILHYIFLTECEKKLL